MDAAHLKAPDEGVSSFDVVTSVARFIVARCAACTSAHVRVSLSCAHVSTGGSRAASERAKLWMPLSLVMPSIVGAMSRPMRALSG
eukprot:4649721-Prymnesium_polylepis.1